MDKVKTYLKIYKNLCENEYKPIRYIILYHYNIKLTSYIIKKLRIILKELAVIHYRIETYVKIKSNYLVKMKLVIKVRNIMCVVIYN